MKIEGSCNQRYDSYKATKFACRSLKNKGNRSGIRIIFVVDKSQTSFVSITFVEMYYKGDKEMNDMKLLNQMIE